MRVTHIWKKRLTVLFCFCLSEMLLPDFLSQTNLRYGTEKGLCFGNFTLLIQHTQMYIFCLWCGTLILWLELHGWFSSGPPHSSVEPGCATREGTSLHCGALLTHCNELTCLMGRGSRLMSNKLRHQCSLNWCLNESGTQNQQQGIPSITIYAYWVENWDNPQRHTFIS